jgi:hypothetical protein
LLSVDDDLKLWIAEYLSKSHAREEYKEFLNLAALMVGLDIDANVWKPGAGHGGWRKQFTQ